MTISKGPFPHICHFVNLAQIFSFKEDCADVSVVGEPLTIPYPLSLPEVAEAPQKPKKFIRWLLDKGYTPNLQAKKVVFFPPPPKDGAINPIVAKDIPPLQPELILPLCDRAQEVLQGLVIEEEIHPDHIICTIQKTLLKDAVQDDKGHIFERKAIEEWLKNNKTCPTCRQPITKLIPNRAITEAAEEVRKLHQPVRIPVEKDVDLNKAELLISRAKKNVEMGQDKEALPLFKEGLYFSNQLEDYLHVTQLFERQKKSLQAALWYLHFARYLLGQNKNDSAKELIEKTFKLSSQTAVAPQLKSILDLFELPREVQSSAQRYLRLARGNPQDALLYLEKAIVCDPLDPEIYKALLPLYEGKKKVHLCLLAYIHLPHLRGLQFRELVRQLDPSYTQLLVAIHLDRLTKSNDLPKMQFYRQVAQLYSRENCLDIAASFFQKIFKCEEQCTEDDFREYIAVLLRQDDKTKAEQMYLRLSQRTKVALDTIKDGINQLGETPALLERQLALYSDRSDQQNGVEARATALKLGSLYSREKKQAEEERAYRAVFDRFKDVGVGDKLVGLLRGQNRIGEIFEFCFQQAQNSYYADLDKLVELYLKQVEQLRPLHQHLSEEQKSKFFLAALASSSWLEKRKVDPKPVFLPKALVTEHTKAIARLAPLTKDLFASAAFDHTIKIWDLQQPYASICTLVGHEAMIIYLGRVSNGNILSASVDGIIKLWDEKNYICLRTLNVGSRLYAFASFAGDRVAVSSEQRGVEIWSMREQKRIDRLGQTVTTALASLDDGTIIQAAGSEIYLWHFNPSSSQWHSTHLRRDRESKVQRLAIHPFGRYFASACEHHAIQFWHGEGRSFDSRARFCGHTSKIEELVFLSGDRLASVSEEGTVKIWNIHTCECLQTIAIGKSAYAVLSISDVVLIGLNDSTIRYLPIKPVPKK